jgi:hypothetical protein
MISIAKIDVDGTITMKEVDHNDMMEYIVDSLKLTPGLMADTVTCYEDENVIYQLCYIDDDNSPHKGCINKYATELVYDKLEVNGPAVLLCSYITNNYTCVSGSLTLEDINKMYLHRTNHIGLKVNTDGSYEEFKFTEEPLTFLEEEERDSYAWFEHNFLTFNLVVYVKKQYMGSLINKNITKLLGIYKIHGPVYIVLKKYTKDYEDLTGMLFEKLLLVAGGSIDNRKLTDEDNREPELVGDIYTLNNSYLILRNRLAQLSNKCHYSGCNELLDGYYTCTGCYRMQYHNEECQRKDWDFHKKECLHKMKPLEHI